MGGICRPPRHVILNPSESTWFSFFFTHKWKNDAEKPAVCCLSRSPIRDRTLQINKETPSRQEDFPYSSCGGGGGSPACHHHERLSHCTCEENNQQTLSSRNPPPPVFSHTHTHGPTTRRLETSTSSQITRLSVPKAGTSPHGPDVSSTPSFPHILPLVFL